MRALPVALVALARMPRTGPRSQDQQQARVAFRRYFVTLLRDPVGQCPGARRLALAVLAQLDLAIDHDQVGVLMDLVLLQLLARRELDRNRTRGAVVGAQDLRLVGLNVERAEIPDVHGAESKPLRARHVARSRSRQECRSARARGSTRTRPVQRC